MRPSRGQAVVAVLLAVLGFAFVVQVRFRAVRARRSGRRTDGVEGRCARVLERVREAVTLAKSYVDDVEFSCEDATRSDRDFMVEVFSVAVECGATAIRLETNRVLGEAIRLYESAGYVEVAPFNDEPYAHHWFEKRLS